MGIAGGLPTPGGDPTPSKNKKPNLETFTLQTDILTGSRNRPNHYILKNRTDALINQADAITNFRRKDKAFLPGVSGLLKKPIKTISLQDFDSIAQSGGTDFLAPNAVAGIRIKTKAAGKTLGTYIFINDATQGFQEGSDAAFFLGRYDLSKSTPFRYEDSSLLA